MTSKKKEGMSVVFGTGDELSRPLRNSKTDSQQIVYNVTENPQDEQVRTDEKEKKKNK